ncbi:MepB family protein [Kitasatospora sp. NPDC094015]|uniref:MepB family protein n=1 Tax=Kitasatospora sp. NPDC094015 TaxID=3155205 RepID=UPI003317E94F
MTELPAELAAALAQVYRPAGLVCSPPVAEAESAEYAAYRFTLEGRAVVFRTAKVTPVKAGLFVTVWQRFPGGPIRPFDLADPVDLFVVAVRDGQDRGQFVLPAGVLAGRGVLARDGVGGKRALRVYPPWVATSSGQARTTQRWQQPYFLPLAGDGPVDLDLARELYRPPHR